MQAFLRNTRGVLIFGGLSLNTIFWFVPVFLFAIVKRSMLAMCIIAFAINLGIWLNKYLMIVPVYSPDARPFTHWIDIAVALGLLAGFLATIVIIAGRLPKFSVWEMNREA